MVTANTPGVNRPCTKRHAMSCHSEVAVAESSVAAASANAAPTMTRLRPTRSASRPATGAATATPNVPAVSVRLTSNVPAWNARARNGSSGCVA